MSFGSPTVCFVTLAIVFALSSSSLSAENLDVWFGTTTPRGGESEGIYHASFNTKTGKLSAAKLAAKAASPGFLAVHPNGRTIYATANGEIAAFRISGPRGGSVLKPLNSVATGDGGAAHVSTDRAGKVVLSAQYGGGSTALFALADDGSIKECVMTKSHSELLPRAGSGVVAKRQDKPHAHWTGTSPDNQFAFVPDLGMDKVVIWKLDNKTPSITHHGFGVCPPGGGPRHMKFSPNGSRIYVLNELALSITVFDYDAPAGTMTPRQTIATLSESTKAKETFNSASEIRVHPSGKFVYSANRGHDSISVFANNASGELELIEVEPIRGGWPRNFNIDPTGRWIIAAGRDSNTATVFEIDQDHGELTFVRQTQKVPTPICVAFGK